MVAIGGDATEVLMNGQSCVALLEERSKRYERIERNLFDFIKKKFSIAHCFCPSLQLTRPRLVRFGYHCQILLAENRLQMFRGVVHKFEKSTSLS